ncbi:hypothetical protein LEL86_35280 [Streptomyces sp. WA6-1-16]|uniref:hypothetical protein n=1 Tax=Streptomyces sp. WA6-1-16 TaxID=2879427 RepID=UPI001CE322B8|nr:hypothetical protein [Streptomyces sp. WA6-1-16]UCA54212.1 hypothetical protein LEL86_35280 [Streptomyces sp. WA6-1-16]
MSVALLVIDLMVIAWLVIIQYGVSSWADNYNGGNPRGAPEEALRGMWLLAAGALVTGGGLLALGWRVPGLVQLVVLGVGAGLLAYFAARG